MLQWRAVYASAMPLGLGNAIQKRIINMQFQQLGDSEHSHYRGEFVRAYRSQRRSSAAESGISALPSQPDTHPPLSPLGKG